ncbi:MAG: hypothetical protein ACFFG0_20775 [Candidatus Thorarchaeota archaeon]
MAKELKTIFNTKDLIHLKTLKSKFNKGFESVEKAIEDVSALKNPDFKYAKDKEIYRKIKVNLNKTLSLMIVLNERIKNN